MRQVGRVRRALVGMLAVTLSSSLGAVTPAEAAAQATAGHTRGGTAMSAPRPVTAEPPDTARAVGGFLPGNRWFPAPVADPLGARISAALMWTDLLSTQGRERPPFTLRDSVAAASEVVAAVSLGGLLPLASLAAWPDGGMSLFIEGRVFARFRVEQPTRDDMGQDWFVSGGVETRRGPWSGRAAITHRSSHLGDEFLVKTGAQRIEFGNEQLDALAAYDVPRVARLYAGGGWIFRSYLDWDAQLARVVAADRGRVQFGADRTWRPWDNRRAGLHAGLDVQAAERTGWRRAISAAAGAGVDSGVLSGRSLRFVARFYDGPSTMGQFFLTPERAFSIEALATF
jgi:hypothetical protein